MNQRRGPGSGGATGRGFKPGQSGNAGGRPKSLGQMAYLRSRYGDAGEELLEAVEALAFDRKQNGTVRIAAFRELLDRGWGRPTQRIEQAPLVPVFTLPAGSMVDLGGIPNDPSGTPGDTVNPR